MDPKNLIGHVLSPDVRLTAGEVILNMFITLLVGLFLYWVYKKTYTGVMYSRSFNITILLTTLITAMVMMVIGTNLALSLGMVGALSVIRFRAAIKEPKDIAFLFWGIAVGLSAGTGAYPIAVIGSIIIAAVLFVMQKDLSHAHPYVLVIKGTQLDMDIEVQLENILNDTTENYRLRMKNKTKEGTEIIYEVRFVKATESNMIEQVQALRNVSNVNLVSYKGDIAG